MDRVLSQTAYLRRSPSLSFIPLPSIQPPPLRGTSFHRKEGVSTRAPSLGRGCRAQRSGVGFLFRRRSRLLFAFPIGEGVVLRKAVDRVLSQTAYLRRFLFPLYHLLETIFFALFHTASTLSGSLRSPPSPRGEGFVRRYSFSTYACIRFDDAGIAASSYRCLPHWGRGTASAVDRVLSLMAYLRRSFPLFFIPLEPYPARFARHLPHAGKGDRAAVDRVLS